MENTHNIVKVSHYNILIKKKDGIAVYNTCSGKMIRSFGNKALKIAEYLQPGMCWKLEASDTISTLYEKSFLVDEEYDELEEMERVEGEAVFDNYLKLIILPTEQCNFRCVYCYEHFKRGKMSIETQQAVIRAVEKDIEKYDGLIVNWFGGEPLEAMDIIEVLSEAFINICRKYKKAYNAGITTNGYYLTVDKVQLLKRLHVTEFQVTLDGVPAVHNQQRVLEDGSGTAEIIIENLLAIKKQIKSSVITIILRTNFSKQLFEYLEEFQRFLDKYFADDSRFQFFWQMVNDYGYIRDESVRNIFGTQQDYSSLLLQYTNRFVNRYMLQLYGPNGGICYALKRNAYVICSDGKIRKCTCDMESESNCFGVIGKEFDNNKHNKWLQRNITKESKCYLCVKRPICHNRACYKSKECLSNLKYIKNILELMSEDEKYYTVI